MTRQFAYTYGSGFPAGTNASELAGVIWGYVQPTSESNMTLVYQQSESGLDPTIIAAHAAGITCKLQIFAPWDWYATGGNNIFTSTTLQNALFDELDDILTAHPDLDGFEMDWEGDERLFNKSAHTTFYANMKARFPNHLIGSTQTFRWSTMTSSAQDYLDALMIMNYDCNQGGGLEWYANMAQVATAVGYWLAEGFQSNKLNLGISFASYIWNGSIYVWNSSYRAMIDNYSPGPGVNLIGTEFAAGSYKFNGLTLVQAKAQYCKDNNLDGAWSYYLAFDKLNDSRSLTKAIYDIIKDEPPTGSGVVEESPAASTDNVWLKFDG